MPWIDGNSEKNYDPLIRDRDHRVLIIPINSSDWCGIFNPLKKLREKEYKLLPDKVQREIDHHRLLDVARVSQDQLDRLSSAISQWETEESPDVIDQTIRVAVLHHHLLPIGEREEIKPFESITNIGLIRRFLADNKIHLVLHGHKHEQQVSYQTIDGVDPSHRVLIVSGSTLGGVKHPTSSVAGLLKISAIPDAPYLNLYDIPAVQRGRRLSWEEVAKSKRRFFLWDEQIPRQPEAIHSTVIVGGTVKSIYNKLLTTLGKTNGTCYNLICHLDCNKLKITIPESMPVPSGRTSDKRAEWIKNRVGWWQDRQIHPPLEHFNHGSRIYDWHGHDQLDNVVNALLRNRESHRAVIQLLDPRRDVFDAKSSFPALCMIQFYIWRTNGEEYVFCNGYFRHQELRLWWLVNVFELYELLSNVVLECNKKEMNVKKMRTSKP